MRRWIVPLSFLLLCGAAPPPHPAATESQQRPNILLIVLDTVRFDATSFGDPAANNTPFLASLASHAVVFTKAYSTHDFTPPSHFSMMTGLRDGLGGNDDRAENGVASQLATTGYSTFALTANSFLRRSQMPVMRGFADVRQLTDTRTSWIDQMDAIMRIDARLAMFGFRPTERLRLGVYFSADRLLPMVEEQMRNAKPPYFGFVNIMDAHEPYVPNPDIYPPETTLPPHFVADLMKRRVPPEFANTALIADPARRQVIQAKLRAVKYPHLLADDLTPEQLAVYRARYRAMVREIDLRLRNFFAALQKQQMLDNTIVIITSDHGEAFGEAGYVTHMLQEHGDREADYHVPLLVVLPQRLHRKAHVVDRVVSIDMLAPTMYDLAGVDWSPFARRYRAYAPSLVSFITASPPHVATVRLPTPEVLDQRPAIEEREKTMRSLGYIH